MLVGNRVRLSAMVTTDTEAILKIYEEGIQPGHATFETEVSDWQKNVQRIACGLCARVHPELCTGAYPSFVP